jgi:SAM-dependent methyltransferase
VPEDPADAPDRVLTSAGQSGVASAYGQDHRITLVDRCGVWLSGRRVRHEVPTFDGLRVADIGCGFDARLARSLLRHVDHLTVVDVALAPSLHEEARVTALEGLLPDRLGEVPDASLDVVLCLSVLEHLEQPLETLTEFRRILAPGGVCLVNVPSWRGKRYLELSAFGLGFSPCVSIDDHKTYYDPRDLWPLLVRAGFAPSQIRCFRHKLGLNTFAVCGPSRVRRPRRSTLT